MYWIKEIPLINYQVYSGTLSFITGDILKLTCISKGGNPAAIIKCKIGNMKVKERILSSSELESNDSIYTTISTVEIMVR